MSFSHVRRFFFCSKPCIALGVQPRIASGKDIKMNNYYDPIETGKRIKELRTSKSMTQEALAEELNVTTDYLSKIERGLRSSSIDVLVDLKNIFNTTLDFLILGIELNCNDFKKDLENMNTKLQLLLNSL